MRIGHRRHAAACGRIMLPALFAIVLCARPAAADPPADADVAREHARRATAAYNLGHYEEAAAEFEAAYRAVPDPALLFNLAQSYRLGGQSEKAVIAYKSYLRTAPPDT